MARVSAEQSRPPRGESQEAEEHRLLARLAAVAAGALGLVGYLYAVGGIDLWLRVQAAQLTPDGAIVATDDRHLLAIGLRVVAFEVFLLIAISIVVAGVVSIGTFAGKRSHPDLPGKEIETIRDAWGSKRTLGGFIGPEMALLLISVGFSLEGPSWRRAVIWLPGLVIAVLATWAMIFHKAPTEPGAPRWDWRPAVKWLGKKLGLGGLRLLTGALLALAIAIGVVVLPVLQGTFLLAGTAMVYSGPFLKWPGEQNRGSLGSELPRSGGVWAAIAFSTAVALAWVATPPVAFTRAVVESADRANYRYGAYLDRGDSGVYLGTCTASADSGSGLETSTEVRITLVPPKESARIKLGQANYQFDPGGRPSLWQAVTASLSIDSAGDEDAPLSHPLKGEVTHACGTSATPRTREAVRRDPLGPPPGDEGRKGLEARRRALQ